MDTSHCLTNEVTLGGTEALLTQSTNVPALIEVSCDDPPLLPQLYQLDPPFH